MASSSSHLMIGREKETTTSHMSGESPNPVIVITGLQGKGKTLAHSVCENEIIKERVGSPVVVSGTECNTFNADAIAKQAIDTRSSNTNRIVILDDWRFEIEYQNVKALQGKLEQAGLRAVAIMITTSSSLSSIARNIVASPVQLVPLEGLQLSCFAYCSLFPQEYLFDAERLIHLWMAEGFLKPSTSTQKSPEDIGREYLREFVGISIFQEVNKDEFGQVKSCRMNPLMHYIAELIHNDDRKNKTVQRESVNLNRSKGSIPDSLEEKQLKSIILYGKSEMTKMTKVLKDIFKRFKELSVLDVRDLGIKKVPKSIKELKKLEYLDLSLNDMEKLPSITTLSKLQTLKLYNCSKLKELADDFGNLTQLKHLDTRGCSSLKGMPSSMNTMTSLETLSAFVASKRKPTGGLEELAKLHNLRGHLEILHLDQVSKPLTSGCLEDKQHLHHLTLRWDLQDMETNERDYRALLERLKPAPKLGVLILEGYRGSTLSSWFTSHQLTNLVKLRFHKCHGCKYLSEKDIQLPQPKILELQSLDYLEFVIKENCRDAAFYEKLEELTISHCPELKSWWQKETLSIPFPHLNSLQRLTINNCRMINLDSESNQWKGLISLSFLALKYIPKLSSLSFIDSVTTLRELTLEKCPGLTSISDSIGKVTLLQRLEISYCQKLMSLPKSMEELKSLNTLYISGCPLLNARCTKDTGIDWPQIRHIKDIQAKKV